MLHADLAKRSVWIMKNYEENSGRKCKNTAVESKKRLEQLSKQLKVSHTRRTLVSVVIYMRPMCFETERIAGIEYHFLRKKR